MRSYHATGLTLAMMVPIGAIMYALGDDDWLVFMAPWPGIAAMTLGLYWEERSA